MNFIEMIGFIISLLALFVLAGKKAYDERRRRENPEQFEREEMEQAEKLKAFLHSVNMDMEETDYSHTPKRPKPIQKPPVKHAIKERLIQPKLAVRVEKSQPQPQPANHYVLSSKPESSFNNHVRREHDAYSIRTATGTPYRATDVLSRLKSKKDLIILQEIISPPKGLTSHTDRKF